MMKTSKFAALVTRENIMAALQARKGLPMSVGSLCLAVLGGPNRGPKHMMRLVHKMEREGVLECVRIGKGYCFRVKEKSNVD